MSMEAAQNRATQREHGRIDGMVGALKKIQEERKAEAEARPVGAMTKEWCKAYPASAAYIINELAARLDARPVGVASESFDQVLTQYAAATRHHDSVGMKEGYVKLRDLFARQALSAAPREVAGWKFTTAGDDIKVTDPSGLSWWISEGPEDRRPHELDVFIYPLLVALAAAPQEGTT
jgi:hypothetical protein